MPFSYHSWWQFQLRFTYNVLRSMTSILITSSFSTRSGDWHGTLSRASTKGKFKFETRKSYSVASYDWPLHTQETKSMRTTTSMIVVDNFGGCSSFDENFVYIAQLSTKFSLHSFGCFLLLVLFFVLVLRRQRRSDELDEILIFYLLLSRVQ